MKIPVLRPEQIEPIDAKLSTTDAKKVFRMFALQTGFLEKFEITEHVGYLADEMRQEAEYLKAELESERSNCFFGINHGKEEIKRLKRELKKCTDPAEKNDIEEDLLLAQEEVAELEGNIAKAEAAYHAFKEDKRAFLVEYINRQTQR